MGQDPAAIREQIEQTRERMGETVDAIGYKADVPARAKDSIGEKVDTLKSKIGVVDQQLNDVKGATDEYRKALAWINTNTDCVARTPQPPEWLTVYPRVLFVFELPATP